MRTKTLQMRNVKPGMVVLDAEGNWQEIDDVSTVGHFTTLNYGDGSEEEGPAYAPVVVAIREAE